MAGVGAEAGSAGGPRLPSLDGVRAIAVTLVFLAHGGYRDIVPGGLGVTVFFVLSGYLITTLMRVEYAQRGTLDLRNFYLRRLLRLMPPLCLVLALAGLLSTLSIVEGGFSRGGLLATLFYAGNYFVIAQDFHGVPDGIGVVWSLAVEEHYYLAFPPLALLLLRKGGMAWPVAVLATLCTCVLAWRCWLAWSGASADYIGMATDTRVDAILVGSLMALTWNPWPSAPAPSRPLLAAGASVLALAVIVGTLAYRNGIFRLTARYTLQSLAVAVLIHGAVAHARWRPYRWLDLPAVAWLGSVSYTVYLCHHLFLQAVARHFPSWGTVPVMVAAGGLTLAFAEGMRRAVDLPMARLRRRLHRGGGVSDRAAAWTTSGIR